VGSHLLADAALLVQNGFSSRAVMAMTERNAQLAALAHVPEPRFALAGALAYAARDTELTEHARGYLDFVEKWVRYIGDNPQQYPQMDARARLLDQFPRLQPEQIHELALTVAREYGLPQRARKILKDTRP
jgi:hypothetical protein